MLQAIRTCQRPLQMKAAQTARQHGVHCTSCCRKYACLRPRLWQRLGMRRCASSSRMRTCPSSPMGISGDRMGESFLRA